jgi:2-hydroxychromene-2-carboxylate isomerase
VRDVAFLFDYASPYSFVANELLGSALPGVRVELTPVYLRGFEAFSKGIPFTAAKLAWMIQDLRRIAAEHSLDFRVPASFPVNGLYTLRGAVAAKRAGILDRYHTPMFRAVWTEGRETSTRDGAAQVIRDLGFPELVDALDDASIKDELRAATDAAAKRGVFGVPTFFVGDDLFWGHDRMYQVARAATSQARA